MKKPSAGGKRPRPSRGKTPGVLQIDFGRRELEYVKTAADLIGLKPNDFVRLSVSQALGNLYETAFRSAAAAAFRLFKKRVQVALNQRFDRVDFGGESEQDKLSKIVLREDEWKAPRPRNKQFSVKPLVDYPGSYYRVETGDKDESAIGNYSFEGLLDKLIYPNPQMPPRVWLMALHITMLHAVGLHPQTTDSRERQKAKNVVRDALRLQVKLEFEALKVRYQAIPGLRSAIQKLVFPPPPEIRRGKAWNDPILLQQYLSWCEFGHHALEPYRDTIRFWPKKFDPKVYEPFIGAFRKSP